MAGKVVKHSLSLLAKFGLGGQERSPKTATSHMRETLCDIQRESPSHKLIKILHQ